MTIISFIFGYLIAARIDRLIDQIIKEVSHGKNKGCNKETAESGGKTSEGIQVPRGGCCLIDRKNSRRLNRNS